MQNSYKNKLFSILGDSISTLEGYSEPRDASFYEGMRKLEANIFSPRDTWWGQVISRLGGELLSNNSVLGSTVTRQREHLIPSYSCSDERTSSLSKHEISPDVIMIFMGINDWGYGARVTPSDKAQEGDLSIFSVAYKSMLEKLKKSYPVAEIWCFTLPVSDYKKSKGVDFPYCYGGRHIDEYCEAIRGCAEKYGCRVIDLYGADVPYDAIDGFHPSAEGMRTLAEAVIARL